MADLRENIQNGEPETWTINQLISRMTSGGTWGPGPLTISYSFPTSVGEFGQEYAGSTELANFQPFSEAQRQAARSVLSLWSDVAGVGFVEVGSGAGAITLANTAREPDLLGGTYFPTTENGSHAGDVWINPNADSNFELAPGQEGYLTLVHELGHALGLQHVADYDGGSAFEQGPRHGFDYEKYSVMSYFKHEDHQNLAAATPMVMDILAIQQMYGANYTTRSGDSTYGFNISADIRAEFDFSLNQSPLVAIWDGGGIDTLDLSGFSQNQVISLAPGSYTSAGGYIENVGIAYGAWIENAVAGSGNDVLIGNELNNVLLGGGGNDSYGFGGAFGHDVVSDLDGANRIVLADLDAQDLQFWQDGSDLLIASLDGSRSARVAGYYTGAGQGAYQFEFQGGAASALVADAGPLQAAAEPALPASLALRDQTGLAGTTSARLGLDRQRFPSLSEPMLAVA
jgi:Ca2+-binding RTX toxin-like protein